ncbi:MAG: hypothetical protein N3D20_02550 [Candidatus Pacearchaeota archaeon]|nr:hypothetical protein [Candidatus Pacearchaeota archaeon]
MIDEAKKEEIREEARKILEKFARRLEKVKLKERKRKVGETGYREEGEGVKGDEDFRKRMFENAPEKDGDCIIAEKKKW